MPDFEAGDTVISCVCLSVCVSVSLSANKIAQEGNYIFIIACVAGDNEIAVVRLSDRLSVCYQNISRTESHIITKSHRGHPYDNISTLGPLIDLAAFQGSLGAQMLSAYQAAF